jgi:hypothetical protein
VLASGYHQTTAYQEIKEQVNLPKQQQLKELLTHSPLAVEKYSKGKWQWEWRKTNDAFDGVEIGLEQLLQLNATEVILRGSHD